MKEFVNVDESVMTMDDDWSPWNVIEDIVASGQQEEPFYVFDIGNVVAKYKQWKHLMPRVEPFYAVKCNDTELVVRVLAALGTGFDCASRAEIDKVLKIGIPSEKIIFANPAKPASHIRYAAAVDVNMMTFDCETELAKIKQLFPTARLVIRIRCDATNVQCNLGMKFGCDPLTEAPRLLKFAASLGLNVIGVSFHVGSGSRETEVYGRAIGLARDLFDQGSKLGFNMNLLDLGGGYPGGTDTSIDEVSGVINEALNVHFPDPSVRVIAEPGRYFVASAFTLACNVHSMRQILNKENELEHTMFFINDGVYGSFNCLLYDHQEVIAEPLKKSGGKQLWCSIWGPSCDGLDRVLELTRMPADLRPGDWLVFRDMGAYTIPIASAFNGFPVPKIAAVASHDVWRSLQNAMLPVPLSPCKDLSSSVPSPDSHGLFVECALK